MTATAPGINITTLCQGEGMPRSTSDNHQSLPNEVFYMA
eukprot:CAMPEP_0175892016 /NCGR_PEP_ID=MMETSP0107_2-20121207/48691_1 /TAXON_ID=195067 ORGANISM="Goniomonas pacifica, Strain CCMP1869" /NCGR_SAMPLE_ID=MMETSP0107_2 /ASSEMBLY_ACC=CAM_ASM_000203 /LENGTH=38 /DNA_ID= /DNA_START= /DNA_END= /DNA_ORIENTATION=